MPAQSLDGSLPDALRQQWKIQGGIHKRFVFTEDSTPCAIYSCGAVAEFHRASRTFRYGTKVDEDGKRRAERVLSQNGLKLQ